MEVEILKKLEDIINKRIFPDTSKVVIMNFELETIGKSVLIMNEKEFEEFRNWLKSKGFIEVELKPNDFASFVLKKILTRLGFLVLRDDRRRGLIYQDNDGKKTVLITYAVDDVVKIYRIIYLEVDY